MQDKLTTQQKFELLKKYPLPQSLEAFPLSCTECFEIGNMLFKYEEYSFSGGRELVFSSSPYETSSVVSALLENVWGQVRKNGW